MICTDRLLLFVLLIFFGYPSNAFTRVKRRACDSTTCENGGVCNTFTANPPCICPLPYIAPHCKTAANYCNLKQPDKGINELPVCLNGGTCTMAYSDPFFNCSCLSGYSGTRCETVTTTAGTRTVIVRETTDLPEKTTKSIPKTATSTVKTTYIVAATHDLSTTSDMSRLSSTTSPDLANAAGNQNQNSLLVKSLAIGISCAVALAVIIALTVAVILKCRNCTKGSGSRYV